MRITDIYIKDLEIEDWCPNCFTVSRTDYSNLSIDELPYEVSFYCKKCHREWVRLSNQYWHMLTLTT